MDKVMKSLLAVNRRRDLNANLGMLTGANGDSPILYSGTISLIWLVRKMTLQFISVTSVDCPSSYMAE